MKTIVYQEIPSEKVYGRDAFDDDKKLANKVNEWSFIDSSNGHDE